MKFTYQWLKQYVAFDWSPSELAARLTMAGIEVENVTELGGNFLDQVVVGQVLASDKHPNADRLSVCRVTDGTEELQIVCGASNYQVGDKIALARVGVTLAGDFTIKAAKLRGVESFGMMCSAKELELAEDAEGLLILSPDTEVGISLTRALGGPDTVYEVEVTPNRPDWLSLVGIAREIAAMTGHSLNHPAIALEETGPPVADLARVDVTATDLCPRYTARVIRGVTIGPSPAWLTQALEKVGMRSINNVVDVTNYVLLETGHPLHAFDYGLLAGSGGSPSIIVRRAQPGETFTAIDNSRHELTEDQLVIADAERPVALAGIMGGQNSEIHDGTTDILLESAWFDPVNVRRTSRRLGLASESSYRFERGADIDGVIQASNRAAMLIQQVAGGSIARGVIDTAAGPIEKRTVACRYAQVNRVLGIEVAAETVQRILDGLGFTVSDKTNDVAVVVEVPSFRVDLEREADLIEEICRIHGVENIPAQMAPSLPAVSTFDRDWDRLSGVRDILNALGFDEAVNQTMVGLTAAPAGLAAGDPLPLQNPLTSDMTVLRASLLPGLLQNLQTNVARHQYDVRLFEIGRVFAKDGNESIRLALAVTGRKSPAAWESSLRGVALDYHDLKGALEELESQLGVELGAEIQTITTPAARKLDLRDAVYLAECRLEAVLAAPPAEIQYRELSRFPAVERDIALIVDEPVAHADVLAAIWRHSNKILETVQLFDIFRGSPIPTGKKSMAYALTYRAAERTLTDAEVNQAHDELKRQVSREIDCELREN